MNLINQIVVGDVLETLKTISENSFDMGVTSPPYNKQKIERVVLLKILSILTLLTMLMNLNIK